MVEFKEFTNPESADYDIEMSLKDKSDEDRYVDELTDLIGYLTDVTDEDIQKEYGISFYEYLHPTKEVVDRVRTNIGTKGFGK